MIPLRARATAELHTPLPRNVWLLTDHETAPWPREGHAHLLDPDQTPPSGFGLYLAKTAADAAGVDGNLVRLPPELDYLAAGDVLSLSPDGTRIKVLWRQRSSQNSVLLTERCDHYCLMCSQPPREVDDDWLLDEARDLIRLLPPDTRQIGFTGGEPTLHGQRLIELLTLCRTLLPNAGVHVLSNGRRFANPDYAAAWASVANPNMMVGIPIYGAEPALHDYVVQAHGAFNDTIQGILRLAELGQRIEVRVVIHKQTAPALVEIAEFIARNIPFVEQVALMGLETTGLARANIDDVWIDPVDYAPDLTEAALLLHHAGVHTMIYNHQLCLIEQRAWPFTVKSISDWKNEYHPECLDCSARDRCGGFFASAKYRYSDHIRAINPTDTSLSLLQLTAGETSDGDRAG
jgi:His-Xaa-Ser system radical SAM maturase HxsC